MTRLARIASRGLVPLLLVLLAALAPTIASATAVITIVNNDGAGEGFNDLTVVPPVGGNPATTIGAQRLYIFQYAANIWGSYLTSAVPILVRSQFNPLTCTPTSATLGSAGPVTIHRDFAGADFPGTWYHAALANKLAGTDLSLANPDINATFNSSLDGGTCLGGLVWYYGTDGLEGVNVELLPVILHEMGHGLGFSTVTSGTSGAFNGGFPAIWDRFLLDKATGLHWTDETAAQRVASAVSNGGLVWDGFWVTAAAPGFLGPRPRLLVNSPGGIAGTYAAGAAAFGAALTIGGVTGDVALADDGVGTTSDACEPLVNGAALSGKIALIDRGTCTFVVKAQAAQAAGAIGLLIGNNVAGPPQPPGGSDPSITIPVIGITQADATTIKANLAGGVNVTIGLDPAQRAGADNLNHVFLYTPNPFQSGSSVSHWDVSLTPNALMEPAINQDLHTNVDLTLPSFQDIGWFPGVTATALARFSADGRADGILVRWQFSDLTDVGAITLQRAPAESGPWAGITTELGNEGLVTTALDTSAEPGVTYFYRLAVMDRAGATLRYGLISGQRESAAASVLFLSAPSPNPSPRGAAVKFRLTRPGYVRLTISDAGGRLVRTLHSGMLLAGEYTREWDGMTEHSQIAPAGMYFVSLGTGEGRKSQRLSIVH